MFKKNFKYLKKSLTILTAAIMISSTPVSINYAKTTPNNVDYYETDNNWARLLQHSLFFYDANMCGSDVKENNLLSWRGNCHVYDSQLPLDSKNTNLTDAFIQKYNDILDPEGDGFVDVSGGFHDAGDHVKFGLPEAYSASVVSWGYYEFRDAYEETGQAAHAETICKYFSDYFMRCTFRDDEGKVVAFCYQVGDGDIDHAYWQAPEIDAMLRPSYFATTEIPTTDVVSQCAAALAINYYNFIDTDPVYANKCLDYAKSLYDFATENKKAVGDGKDGPKSYYTSSKWEDDYSFASCWLYLITKDHKYIQNCLPYIDYYAPPGYVLCWNDMWNGVSILLGRIQEEYPQVAEEYRTAGGRNPYELIDFWYMSAKAINTYINGDIGTITPAGYFWLNTWGSARYNTAAQFTALVYDKYNKGKDKFNEKNPDYSFSKWALGQMEYIIGDNPINRCYVVGYSDVSAKYPHHRAASGLTKCEDTKKHKHVLYGALVGGPDKVDNHIDVTADWIYNEVTIDYNAAFVGASAGLYNFFGDSNMKPDENFPPEEAYEDSTDIFSGNDFWVSGYCEDKPESTGAGVTKLTFFVNTDSLTPKTDISVRYYFDISEFTSNTTIPSSFVLQKTYDQVQTEVADKEAVLSKPIHYKDKIYYVEISWPDYAIANSNKKYQFILGMYYGDNWDSANDWSRNGITTIEDYDNIVGGTELAHKCENVCVYSNGVLIGGIEPDGTTPKKVYTVTQLVRLKQALLGVKPFTSDDIAKQFDFTKDGVVDLFDILILKNLLLNN